MLPGPGWLCQRGPGCSLRPCPEGSCTSQPPCRNQRTSHPPGNQTQLCSGCPANPAVGGLLRQQWDRADGSPRGAKSWRLQGVTLSQREKTPPAPLPWPQLPPTPSPRAKGQGRGLPWLHSHTTITQPRGLRKECRHPPPQCRPTPVSPHPRSCCCADKARPRVPPAEAEHTSPAPRCLCPPPGALPASCFWRWKLPGSPRGTQGYAKEAASLLGYGSVLQLAPSPAQSFQEHVAQLNKLRSKQGFTHLTPC